jgi:hypothetical protein
VAVGQPLKVCRPAAAWRAAALTVFAALVTACSGFKPYPDTREKNFQVHTRTDSGSIFSKVRASLDISRVDAQCRTEYEGTVDLKKAAVKIGIPAERWSYLVFYFSSSGFLSSRSSTMSQATLLKPRAGYRYDAEVTYRDDTYYVVIHESRTAKGDAREIALRRLDTCDQG